MSLQNSNECPACGSKQTEFLTSKSDYPIHRCGECRHGYVRAMPDEETLSAYYKTQESDNQYAFPEESVRKHSRRLMKWMNQAIKKPGRMLDVGCGQGVHLELARDLGWEVEGIDHSPTARRICEQRGIRVYATLEEFHKKNKDSQKKYDLISFWEVIEHLTEPQAFLESLKPRLKEDGFFTLSTPNFESRKARADYANWFQMRPPEHLQYFTPQSLRAILQRQGLHVLDLITIFAWDSQVESAFKFLTQHLKLSEYGSYIGKIACYKFGKFYFDRKLQSKEQGENLLVMASLTQPQVPPQFRKYFYF